MTNTVDKSIIDRIDTMVKGAKVVLFMKGTAQEPRCGFSGFVVQALQNLKVDFVDYDVLEDEDLRQGIKEYSDWPTIPQLYIRGEFIGGCDIVREMLINGDLSAKLE